MSKKILGAIFAIGATSLASVIAYNRGYENGYFKAMRTDDEYDSLEDDFDNYDEEEDFVCCDENSENSKFSFPEFLKAVEIVKEHHKANLRILKDNMHISYEKAKAILDYMEKKGYIGCACGNRPRDIYINRENNI